MGGLDSIVCLSSGNTRDNLSLIERKSLKEHPNLTFSFYGSIYLLTLATVDFPEPVWDAISLVGRSNPEKTTKLALIGVGTDCMV
jgi:hypothetical protein